MDVIFVISLSLLGKLGLAQHKIDLNPFLQRILSLSLIKIGPVALRKMNFWQLYNDTSNDIIWRRGWTTDDGQISIKKSSLLSSEDSRLWVITDLTLAWNKQEIGTPLRQFTLPEAIKKYRVSFDVLMTPRF